MDLQKRKKTNTWLYLTFTSDKKIISIGETFHLHELKKIKASATEYWPKQYSKRHNVQNSLSGILRKSTKAIELDKFLSITYYPRAKRLYTIIATRAIWGQLYLLKKLKLSEKYQQWKADRFNKTAQEKKEQTRKLV